MFTTTHVRLTVIVRATCGAIILEYSHDLLVLRHPGT